MRIYLYMFISLLVASCQLDLDVEKSLEKIPVYDIVLPNNISINTEQTISFKYGLKNGCYSLYEIESSIIGKNTLVTTVFAEVDNTEVCTQEYSEQTYSFTFTPKEKETYSFKFWIGVDSQGMDQYEVYEVVIE